MATAEEIKAAEDKAAKDAAAIKEAEDKAAAEAAAREAARPKVVDGKVELSENDYNNLVNMKGDMITYKEAKRKAETELEAIKVADLKAKEEQLEKDKKFEELYKSEQQKTTDLATKFKNQEIDNAIMVKAMKEGIKKSEYVKLIDKSKIEMDDSDAISGIDEIVESFKKENAELFGTNVPAPPGVDTTLGGGPSGPMTDADILKMTAAEITAAKKTDPAKYKRWSDLATHNQTIPERNKDKED